jgi:hypothetical protein
MGRIKMDTISTDKKIELVQTLSLPTTKDFTSAIDLVEKIEKRKKGFLGRKHFHKIKTKDLSTICNKIYLDTENRLRELSSIVETKDICFDNCINDLITTNTNLKSALQILETAFMLKETRGVSDEQTEALNNTDVVSASFIFKTEGSLLQFKKSYLLFVEKYDSFN